MMWHDAEDIVATYSIGLEERDRYAEESFAKACKAIENKSFRDEIVSVEVKEKKRHYRRR